MKDFLEIQAERKIYQDDYFFIIEDAFPVSPGYLLIVSNRVNLDFFSLSKEEKIQLIETIEIAKQIIEKNKKSDGYNIGMNCVETARKTVFHFHYHLIPRYKGDMEEPRGGVRHCINGKGYY